MNKQTEKKFIDSGFLEDYEIYTDSGWVDAIAIHKTVPYDIWTLSTGSYTLKCADTHIVFNEKYQEVFVKDLKIGDLIQTELGTEAVTEIIKPIKINEKVNMFDIELPESSNHRYFTDGILSHNTTSYTVFCLWMVCFYPEKTIMIAANKLQTSIMVMDKIRMGYEYLPTWIKPSVSVYNKAELTLGNKSSIRAFATSSSAARGFTCSCVIVDEMAFIPKNIINEFFSSVVPSVSSSKDSKVIVVSTPNGGSGLYYDIWKQANSKETKNKGDYWTPFRIDWWEVPGRDEEWKETQILTIGVEKWKQEYCNEFLVGNSFNRLIPDDIIERYKIKLMEYKKDGILSGKEQKIISESESKCFPFTMWHEFNPERTYLASADVAEGTGGDQSVLYIFDITNINNITQCVKFSSNTTPTVEFAFVTNRILGLYNNPYFVCESNGIGTGFMDTLSTTYGYQNIVREGKDNKYGVSSHVQIKGKACIWLREMFTTEGVNWVIYDKDLIEDMTTFIKKESKTHIIYNAMAKSHDDYIMTLCWIAWILNPEVIENYYVVSEILKTSMEKIIPKTILPLVEYTQDDIGKVVNDPIYTNFLLYKDEMLDKLKTYNKKEIDIKTKAKDNKNYSFDDLFFNGDSSGGSWNEPITNRDEFTYGTSEMATMSNKPIFFIN